LRFANFSAYCAYFESSVACPHSVPEILNSVVSASAVDAFLNLEIVILPKTGTDMVWVPSATV